MTEPFAEYRGTAYHNLVDPDQRAALEAWSTILRWGEGNRVDGAHFIDSQIYLCAQTAEYIYSDYTPTVVNHAPGSRPGLEKVVRELGVAGLPDFRKFLWLMRFVRDLPDTREWHTDLFSGGTEEDLIAKRVWVCNEQARLLIVLCQVAGLPARYVGHHIGGHGAVEAWLDGHWSYCDVRGKFFLRPDGKLASVWEIWQNPAQIRAQPAWVQNEIHPRYAGGDPYLRTESAYFNPRECTGVVNYFVADHDKYDYTWGFEIPGFGERTAALRAERDRVREKLGMKITGGR
ncbi:MAG TPA: transglutaminase domain-containing protein [Planctomycetota bacterium]|nr:transglutaminase domain-containing protein [Planctomycetota bacterium]